MKKMICLVCVLIFALNSAALALSTPAPQKTNVAGVKTYFENVWMTSNCMTRDMLYVKDYNGVVWKQAWNGEPEVICHLLPEGQTWKGMPWQEMEKDDACLSRLVYGDDQLWAVTRDKTGTVDENGIHWQYQYDSDEPGRPTTVDFRMIVDGKLIGIDMEAEYLEYDDPIMVIDLTSGKMHRVKVKGAYSMTAYQNGLLLLRMTKTGQKSLSYLDLKTEKITDLDVALPQMVISAVSYDEKRDMMALMTERAIYIRHGSGEFEKAINIPAIPGFNEGFGQIMITAEGIVVPYDTITLYPLDGGNSGKTTSVKAETCFISPDTEREFMFGHPGTTLEIVQGDDVLSPSQVAERIRSGDPTDVYGLWLKSGSTEMINRGYALELQDIVDTNGMLPALKNRLINQKGVPCAVPLTINLTINQVNKSLWEELLQGTPIPETWLDYLTLQKETIDEFLQDGFLLQDYFTCEDTFYAILQAWICQAIEQNREPVFSDPVLTETLEALYAVHLAMKEHHLDVLDEADLHPESEVIGDYSLITSTVAETVLNRDAQYIGSILPPFVFEKGDSPVVCASAQALLISPQTRQPQLAGDLLRMTYQAWQTPARKAMMYPDNALATERDEYQEKKQELLQKKQELMEAHAAQDALDRVEGEIAANERRRYLISPDGAAWWNAWCNMVRIPEHPLLDSRSSVVGEQLMQYGKRWLDGQISTNELVRQLDEKTRMIAQEAE